MRQMKTWSRAGYLSSAFEIEHVEAKRITVKLKNNNLRNISENDFMKVFDRWPDYLKGRISREALGTLTHNSTYILTILHELEGLS